MRKIIVAIALLAFLGAKPSPASGGCKTCSDDASPAQAVVLVHGRNDSPSRWNALVAYFTASGRGYTENTDLFRIDLAAYCGDNSFCSVLSGYSSTYVNESYAKCLKAFIDEKLPCSGETCPAVDIITHSQGGVVARWYTQFLRGTREVNDLVAMSATHNGITNCALAGACTGVNPEVCPDSAFLRTLNGVSPQGDGSNDETPGGAQPNGPINYGSVVSNKDMVVPPWCGGYFILNPQTQQGDDLNCSGSGNYTLDSNADQCLLTKGQHLQVPTDSKSIQHAYCVVNED